MYKLLATVTRLAGFTVYLSSFQGLLVLLSAVFGSTSCNVDVPVSKCTPSPVKFSSKITPVAADVGKITDQGFCLYTSS